MKTLLQNLIILTLALSVISCTGGGGGGVSTENTNPGGGGNSGSTFSESNSNFILVDHTGLQSSNEIMGQTFHPLYIAKDSNGNPYTTLSNIKVVVVEDENPSTSQEINLIHSGNGVYSADFTSAVPKKYQFSVKLNDVVKNDIYIFKISACSNNETSVPRNLVQGADTYKVLCNVSQLQTIQSNLAGKYILGQDIDLSVFYIDINGDYVPDNQFMFGSVAAPFTGTLKGLGNIQPIIRDFRFNGDVGPQSDLGLFSKIAGGAVIENIAIQSAYITGQNNIGILAGSIDGASGAVRIANVSINSGSLLGESFLGGIAGQISSQASSRVVLENVQSELSLFYLSQSSSSSYHNIGGISGRISGSVDVLSPKQISLAVYQSSSLTERISLVGGIAGSSEGSLSPQNYIPLYKDVSSVSSDFHLISAADVGGAFGLLSNSEMSQSLLNPLSSTVLTKFSVDLNPAFAGSGISAFAGSISNSTVKKVLQFLGSQGSDSPSATGLEKMSAPFSGFSSLIESSTLDHVALYGFNLGINISDFAIFADQINNSNLSFIKVDFTDPLIVEGSSINSIYAFAKIINSSSLKNSEIIANISTPATAQNLSLTNVIASSTIEDISISLNLKASSKVSAVSNFIILSSLSNLLINSTLYADTQVFGIAENIEDTQISHVAQVSLIKNLAGNSLPQDSSIAIKSNESGDTSAISDFVYYSVNTGLSDACIDPSCQNSNFTATSVNTQDYFYNKNNSPYTSWDFTNVWYYSEDNDEYPSINFVF